ncbi:uncharacterized protein BDZ99DRAFT_573392 [Mytilinidion resinicola]|uniref:Histone deacetylase interacting domain-containing protein n=1 Tax=Mytilinidion resinicola TaxID=574789 RepID=A0A6A6YCT9_9PEZI|nr:uncharacterized protein BDZ99DRAFT_573392 [Mytilinidion resinicola]KAF2806646.1 hypothetical protein BDZ99DRAFT_573392 [Mytilinidion resinicola]
MDTATLSHTLDLWFDRYHADSLRYSSSNATQQQIPQASASQSTGPVLPPPTAPFYSSNQSSPHNLPAIAGLTQATQASPSQSAQRPPSSNQESASGPQPHQNAMQGPGYSLPGISQTLQQPHLHAQNQASLDRDREMRDRDNREREIMEAQEEAARREAEHREREMRERQQQHEAAIQSHSETMQIHQPVAVAPAVRTIHGPNGLLGNSATLSGTNALSASIGAPNGPGNIFGGGAVQQGDATPRMQPAVQPQAQSSMLMPFGGPGMPGQLGMVQGQQPILNDALSYLDQVKVQFADHPDVYNKFLDIMKDFKSGAIDTPGVIERVSTLFAGNPNLIQGFNTFLPPGYKIECGTGGDPNAIRVTTPMGTTVSSMPVPRPLSAPRSAAVNGNGNNPGESPYYDSASRGASGNWQQARAQDPQEAMFSPNNRNLGHSLFGGQQGQHAQAPLSPEAIAQRNHQDAASTAAAMAHQQEQRGVSQLQSAVSAAATGRSLLSPSGESAIPLPIQGMNGASQVVQSVSVGPGGEKRGPVEFNHAISYVNKIKNRFASQPDIYKQFLEILQTYQRESKPIQDVYAQVTSLFNSAPDLLEDFKQFLPESAAQHRAAQQQAAARHAEDAVMLSNVRGEAGYQAGSAHSHQTPRADASRLPPMGNFAPTPTANRDNKRKRGERPAGDGRSAGIVNSIAPEQGSGGARAGYGQANIAKESAERFTPIPNAVNELPIPPLGLSGSGKRRASPNSLPRLEQQVANTSPTKRAKTAHTAKQPMIPDGPAVSPTLTPALPEPIKPVTTTVATGEELAFFDRAKKFIGNKNTMNEFLKLCNLFSQDLIDKNLLYARAQSFIGGNPDLLEWFRQFLSIEKEETVIKTKARTVTSRVSLSNCRGLGPSYRLLPKRERERVCSGRDQLCQAVLNDEWASHPTWASEDSGFVAHRKNQYEEGLHRIEEERHDYDHNIEACIRTIQQLEPIATQLLQSSADERLTFVLPPGLGGQSESIYKRVIRKIYGRDKGNQVIIELFAQPYNVIPVLLSRLKQKLEEWKAAQREWEKVWREQTQKIFWKSLDHQSLGAKQADKRQFQLKTLQNEIQVKYEEQRRQLEFNEIKTTPYQFAYSFKDEDVLFDTARLIICYIDHASHTGSDSGSITKFIKEFVPLFFGIDPTRFEQGIHTSTNGSPRNESGEEETMSADDGSSQKGHKSKKQNLLRGVLDRGRGKSARKDKDDSAASESRDSTPDHASAAEEEFTAVASGSAAASKDASGAHRWATYATRDEYGGSDDLKPDEPYVRDNYNMYCNLTIYCFFRMFVILYERLSALKQTEPQVRETVARAKQYKPATELKMIDKYPEDFFGDTSDTANYYEQMLTIFEDQIKGEVDAGVVEETLRRYYLQSGWQLYSIDRLLSSLIRFAAGIFPSENKDKTGEVYQAFKKDRPFRETTHRDEISYRRIVEKNIKDGDVYKINYDTTKQVASVNILKKDDDTYAVSTLDKIKAWRYYIASYTLSDPTENVAHDKVHLPYLKRSIGKVDLDIDEPGDRIDSVRSEEKKAFKIMPDRTYTMKYLNSSGPYEGVDFLVQKDAVRSGFREGEAEMSRKTASRNDSASERLLMNTTWMKNVSREDVDARKDLFRKETDDNPSNVNGTVDSDETMADA